MTDTGADVLRGAEHGTAGFARKRGAFITAALILLIAALVWRIALSSGSLAGKLVKTLAEHGCIVSEGALYQERFERDASIAELMEGRDMSQAIEISRASGFSADIERKGDVYILLADMGGASGILTLFVVNEEIELAFIQIPNSDELLPIWGGADRELMGVEMRIKYIGRKL